MRSLEAKWTCTYSWVTSSASEAVKQKGYEWMRAYPCSHFAITPVVISPGREALKRNGYALILEVTSAASEAVKQIGYACTHAVISPACEAVGETHMHLFLGSRRRLKIDQRGAAATTTATPSPFSVC